ncbi:MAG: hypothetical protein ACI4LJ_07050 [Anaerovoracaceae bacterium]
MKRNNRVWRKLHSRRGESLAEVLVAILICAVSLLMLSSAIYSAGSILDRSGQKMDEIYAGINSMEAKSGENVTVTGNQILSVSSEKNPASPNTVSITIYQDEGTGLASYKRSTP